MKQHLSTADRNDIVSVACFVDEIDRVISQQSANWDEDIIAQLSAGLAYARRSIELIAERLPKYEVDAVTKVIDRHQCYVASRTHDPNRDELPISKDKLVSAGLAVMEACDICDHQAEFEQCAIFHLMREYFDIDRGGAVCPYDANGGLNETR